MTTTFVFDVDAGYGEALVARLNRFRIRVKADVEPLPWRVIAVRGVDGVDDVVGPDPVPPAGVREGTLDELERARIDAGWPAMGAEIVPGETIPAETGDRPIGPSTSRRAATPARSSSSGWTPAAPPRRAGCACSTVAEGAKPGDPIVHDGAEVGVLTSVAGTRALGLVRRNVELGDEPADRARSVSISRPSRPDGGRTVRAQMRRSRRFRPSAGGTPAGRSTSGRVRTAAQLGRLVDDRRQAVA